MFTHLRVASGFSFQHGANHPEDLVAAAAERGYRSLALTDRGGVSGAVRFVQASQRHDIRPILGADLAITPALSPPRPRTRQPHQDRAEPARVVVLATADDGWASLCRLLTAAHRDQRKSPLLTADLLAEHAANLVVLFGSDSPVGQAVTRVDRDAAVAELRAWRQVLPAGTCYVAPSHLRVRGRGPGSRLHAQRLLAVAAEAGVGATLTNTVRMLDAAQGPTIGILDAARRRVALDWKHLDQTNAECWLKPPDQMAQLAVELAAPGLGHPDLITTAADLADRCQIDPLRDLGLGAAHLPEYDGDVDARLAERCRTGLTRRYEVLTDDVYRRLDDELAIIAGHGFASYFLTVADVVARARSLGIRVAARGSGAGSLVNYLLDISGVDPVEHHLLMERFLSDRRRVLPDIDIDVESARRLEIYRDILDHWGPDRVAAVGMVETYRVRHAVRDVGAALSMPPVEVDAIAKAFPHISAGRARQALTELPELRRAGLDARWLDPFFALVESLDGLPRNLAMHPCGIVICNASLPQRTPIGTSADGYPLSPFDKDDVEALGLLKLDVLGVRMQSSMAHAVTEIERTTGEHIDLDALAHDDQPTYDLIRSTNTLGCFQIESPGQRELIGKFAPENFTDIIIDISLFRPGPVKSDMVRPFLEARQGWTLPRYPHPDLRPVLAETFGVVVFHEQVIEIIAIFTGCCFAEADEARRALGTPEGQERVRSWFGAAAQDRGYRADAVASVWDILAAFASFGFCKAHAAAFALPTYQSAWLKTHWSAHFTAGVLTHDPGMYPKRLILADARARGIPILGVDVNHSDGCYRAEAVGDQWGLRVGLGDLAGITDAEIDRITTARPYVSLTDFWHRAQPSHPTCERLIRTGAFDALYPRHTRRDLLLHLSDLHRGGAGRHRIAQPALSDIDPVDVGTTGLPAMTRSEQIHNEVEVFGLDITGHVLADYEPMLTAIGVTRVSDLLDTRNGSEILVAGAKVATQTPPVRSGERVIFLTLDDGTGCSDLAYFTDMQGKWASTVFGHWLLLARGVVRRSGPRGVSLRATGCWDLADLQRRWDTVCAEADPATAAARIAEIISANPTDYGPVGTGSAHRVLRHASGYVQSPYADVRAPTSTRPPRTLWHASPGSSGPTR